MWIFNLGCCKFTVQDTLRYVDRLSPLLLILSKVATPLQQDRRKSVLWILSFSIWQLQSTTLPRREQNLMSSLCYCLFREGGVEDGAASPHSHIWDYIPPSTWQSFSMLYSSINLHLSSLFLLNWAFLSPVFSYSCPFFSPPTHPQSYYHISLPHELYSQAESKSNRRGKILAFCKYTSLVTSAALRIIAQVANF